MMTQDKNLWCNLKSFGPFGRRHVFGLSSNDVRSLKLQKFSSAKIITILSAIMFLTLSFGSPAYSQVGNSNSTAVKNADQTGISNANCNSALTLDCSEPSIADESFLVTKEWELGANGFPGGDTGLENTVSYMSGKTNAVFSSPSPTFGNNLWVVIISFAVFYFFRRRRFQ